MRFHIPFTVSSIERIKKKPIIFPSLIHPKKDSKIQFYLNNSDTGIMREQYLNVVLRSLIVNLVLLYIVLTTILALLEIQFFYLFALGVALAFAGFVAFSQLVYPKIYSSRKDKDIERNLIPALEDMLVQLNAGVPLFSILINISSSSYGQLSNEFKKGVKEINAGLPQIEVLEGMGDKSSSKFFRRSLWQISNGMKAGSDISIVIEDSIKSLNAEQLIQIQKYGNKLNPLIMFYMLISVILPALAIAFLTIVSSLVSLPSNTTMLLYIGLFIFIVLIQIVFLGTIRSSRPSLL